MKFIYQQIFYLPLYNLLAFLAEMVPTHNLGLAIIILTLLVKLVLFPFYHKTRKIQLKIKAIEPELKKIKQENIGNKQAEALKTMALYREHGISPLSGFGIMLIQLPILFALYGVFRESLAFDPNLLYSFVSAPETVNHVLFFIDLTKASYVLAILAGITQFVQVKLALPGTPPADRNGDGKTTFSEDLARSMNVQAKYFLPVMITLFSLGLPGAISLYWVVGNLFMIAHELLVKHRAKVAFTAPNLSSTV